MRTPEPPNPSSPLPASRLVPLLVALLLAPLASGPSALRAQDDGGPRTAEEPAPLPTFVDEVRLPALPALSQGLSGTCWSFATTSFLESEVIRLRGTPVDLAEMFPVYHGYGEKARRYVRLHGSARFSEGGLAHDVLYVASRHGLVPRSTYSGLVGDQELPDTLELESALKGFLDAVAQRDRTSANWPAAVRGILDAYLGRPPESVEVGDGATVTPVEYARDVLGIRAEDYVQVMSMATEPWGDGVELLVPDNWLRYGEYRNVPLADFLDGLERAVRAGYTAAVDLDVSEQGARGPVWDLSEAERAAHADGFGDEDRRRLFDSRETTDDHLMHVVGVAKRADDGRLFFLTKNSWGDEGPYEGHVYVSREFMAAKLLSYMVHQDALGEEK